MNMASLEQFLATAFLVPHGEPTNPACIWGLPVNIEGLSGIGKSERIQAAGAAVGLNVQTVYPATKQPEDFTGAPFATPNGVVIECILPQARKLLDTGYGVLFIDEISCARPAVQAALLSVVNERRVGDHILPPKVRVVTAMNPPEYAAGGFGLEPPLANRLAHVAYRAPSADEWIDWLLGNAQLRVEAVLKGEQRVTNSWPDEWPEVRGQLVGFMKRKPSLIHQQPKPDDADSGGAWPSHRTWNWAGRAKATAACLYPDLPVTDPSDENQMKAAEARKALRGELERELVQACVGQGVMKEWLTWLRECDLPKPLEMLTNGWTPNPQRLDITAAALTSMVTYLTGRPNRKEQLKLAPAAWDILGRCMDKKISDMAVKSSAALVKHNVYFDSTDATPELKKVSEEVVYRLGQKGLSKYANALGL